MARADGPSTPRWDAGSPARLLVVGASSGIGRAVALSAAEAGHQVLATARRADRLADLAEQHGNIRTQVGDVRRDTDCEAMVAAAVRELGGLDAFVYATGASPLGRLVDSDGDAWRMVMETNVIGAAQICRAALPELTKSSGRAIFLSSISADDPRPFLVPYGASKAALDAMIRGWRNEHPGLCLVRIVVGPTSTEFGAGWDRATLAELAKVRAERNLVRAGAMSPAQVAEQVLHALDSPVWTEDVVLVPPGAAPRD